MDIFDAVSIEHTLARFFGERIGARGTFFDADTFRAGDPKDLAEVIRRVADTLEDRISVIRFPAAGNGTAKALVEGCVRQFRSLSDRVGRRRMAEREDYHWEVFGAVMMAVVGLLETLEAQVPRQ